MPMKPKSSESKQDFLARCIKDGNELRACVASWNTERLEDQIDSNVVTLVSEGFVKLKAQDEQAETKGPERFAILAYTGAVINRWWSRFVIDLSGISTKEAFPILREHSPAHIVGYADTVNLDDDGLYLEGTFSTVTQDGQEVLGLAREKFPWQASIGVRALVVEEVQAGAVVEVNGQKLEGPLDVWRQSKVFETSFVTAGADDETAAVAMSAAQPKTPIMEEQDMSKKNEDTTNPVPAEQAAAAAADDAIKRATEEATKEAVKLERERCMEIRSCVLTAGLDASLADELIEAGLSLSTAKGRVLDALAEKNKPAPKSHSLEAGDHERDKVHLAVVDGFLARLGVKPAKGDYAPGHEDFLMMTPHDLARTLLYRSGNAAALSMNSRQLADVVFADSRRCLSGGHSTSDFPEIYRDVVSKQLIAAYREYAPTWKPFCNESEVNDFKEVYGVRLSEAPTLTMVKEGGEYKYATLAEARESGSVDKYGEVIGFTWESFVNNDLRSWTRLPSMLTAAAYRLESDVVYGIITGNPVMYETGKTLFHADHHNLETVTGNLTAPNSTSLSAGRAAMRLQTGLTGVKLDLRPKFILVPVALETETDIVLRSASLPEENMPAGTHNPWNNRMTPISDPRLDDDSTTAWYQVADPSQIDTIEVLRLVGERGPVVTTEMEFIRDAIAYKVRHVFGAYAADFRGIRKNPGTTG